MISISKLYLGHAEASDHLRYTRRAAGGAAHGSLARKPVVVWNITSACNLKCVHCYAEVRDAAGAQALSHAEGRALIDDLAAFGVPVLLLSGGEPLARPDVLELAAYAAGKGMRVTFSTNGTMIDRAWAARFKQIGVGYVGISLDGLRETNDRFRGVPGAFDRALDGIRACRAEGVKVGLRYTLTRANLEDLPGVFDLIEQEDIPRACFYHLVYTGRGKDITEQDLTHDDTRRALDLIIDRTAAMHARGAMREILTVDNHADGPYLYLRMLRERNPDAEKVLDLLRINGGNSTGAGIGCVSWDGTVYPDQFWRTHPLGNVTTRPFSIIWSDPADTLLAQLRDKKSHVPPRCAACRFLDVCGGNFRARGEAATGDLWGFDPACYLTDEEIGI